MVGLDGVWKGRIRVSNNVGKWLSWVKLAYGTSQVPYKKSSSENWVS